MTSILGDFFDRIWGLQNKGLVYLPTDKKDDWHKVFFRWPEHRASILAYVDTQTAMGREVYYSPALYDDEVLKPDTVVSKDRIVSIQVLWADFDGEKGTPAPLEWTHPDIPEPSMQIQTSEERNRHVYWFLDEPTNDISFIENSNRSITYSVGGDTGCWNAVRLLRPPGSVNFGYNKPWRNNKSYDVNIVDSNAKEPYSRESFAKLKPVRLAVNQAILLSSDIPDIEHLKMAKPWVPEMMDLFRANPDDISDRSGALLRMAYFGAELEWSDTEIYGLIEYLDREHWHKYTHRKDRDNYLTDMVERARRKYPAGADGIMFRGLRKNKSLEYDPRPFYTLREFMAEEFLINWKYEGLLSRNGYLILFGPSGVGKTQLALQLCADTAGGRNFLCWDKTDAIAEKILFLSLEMNPAHLKFFTDQQSEMHKLDTVLDNFIIAPWGQAIMLDKPEGKQAFERLLETLRPNVLVIDSYAKILTKSLSEDVPNREMSDYLQAIRERFDVAMVILHHTNKINLGPELDLSDFFGSTYIFTNADSVLGLGYYDKSDPDFLCLNIAKTRLAKLRPALRLKRGVGLRFDEIAGDVRASRNGLLGKADRSDGFFKDIWGEGPKL